MAKAKAKTKTTKISITMKALISRIQRKLAREGKAMKAERKGAWIFGKDDINAKDPTCYIVDLKAGAVVEQDIDPIALATRLGVLKPWETVAAGAVKVREVVVAHRVFRPQQGR